MKKLMTIAAGALFLTLVTGSQQVGAGNGTPPGDAFKCYPVQGTDLKPPRVVQLVDQFESDQGTVVETDFICNPASLDGSSILDFNRHYACFLLKGKSPAPNPPVNVRVTNILGVQEFKVRRPETLLCAPSTKTCLDDNGEGIACPNED